MTRRSVWRVSACALAVSLTACGVAVGETRKSTVLPTERCGDFYMVQMAFGGDADRILSMLLDTGASHTVIDPDSLERVSGKRIETGRRARLPEMTAGEITFKGMEAWVRSLDHLQLTLGKPLDGILGFPAFRKLLLTMDYPREEVRVRFGSLPPPDGKRILRTFKEKRRPVIKLTFGSQRRLVLIDSGSFSGFVLNESKELRYAAEPVAYDSSLRIDRVMIRSGARLLDDLQFATARLATPTVVVGKSTNLVGAGVLRHFSVTYDQQKRRVLFERSGDEPIDFPPVRDIGWALRPNENGYEVLRVFEGFGASRAGVEQGDLVVAIDGTPVYERDLCDREPEQRAQVRVTVEREGQRIEFDVPVDIVVP